MKIGNQDTHIYIYVHIYAYVLDGGTKGESPSFCPVSLYSTFVTSSPKKSCSLAGVFAYTSSAWSPSLLVWGNTAPM